VPVRKDPAGTPRVVSDRAPAQGPIITTTYTVKPESQPVRNDREGHRSRRSTLDGATRPTIINAQPRSPAIHGGAGRPPSPLHDPYRSSGEGGEYMAIPASSRRYAHHRQSYSATMDNADVHKLSREARSGGMLGVGSGREGARYPTRHRTAYPAALVRHPDTVADDYGDDGYGYTNPQDLVQYDLNRSAKYPPPRRDSYEGSRPARPSSISGYADLAPRSYDKRERGPPPASRGLDMLAARSPLYDAPPARLPSVESGVRSPRKEQFYHEDRPRQPTYRRPVSIMQDRPHHDDYYDDLRGDEIRERRESQRDPKRYDERGDYRERSYRNEPNGYDNKRREHRSRNDHDSGNDSDNYDDRAERKHTRDKHVSRDKDHDKRNDHDRNDENDDHKERKRDKLATSISVAAAALGVGAAAKNVKHEESDDDRDNSDDHKRRRDGEEHRRRKEHRDDKGSVDLNGRDPKERQNAREDRDMVDDGREKKARTQSKEDQPIDLAGRNPQERPATKETREDAEDSKEHRRNKNDAVDDSSPSSREGSPLSGETTGRRRIHKDRGNGPDVPFKATNTMDLRAMRDALNKKDGPAPPAAPAEAVREGSFERKREPNIQLEPAAREGRGRRDTSDSEEERRPTPRLVSPPREVKKAEENKPRGILRPPREKFPEDPVPIREGVAPLKDAKKDGVPPDARWTKISRRLVNPEALEAGKERYEAREDFVIVLRVLTKDEIQAYANKTQQIRG